MTSNDTLARHLWPRVHPALRATLFAVIGSAALWASAKIQIPFWPVPMTMQTFVVMLIAMTAGPRLAAATVALYIAQGAVGLPVFAGTPLKGIGLAYIAGPTGGYIAGFLLATIAVGALAQRQWDRSIPYALAAVTIGTAIIFACGLLWLSTFVGWNIKLLQLGLVPFLTSEALKIALAACIIPSLWKISRRDSGRS